MTGNVITLRRGTLSPAGMIPRPALVDRIAGAHEMARAFALEYGDKGTAADFASIAAVLQGALDDLKSMGAA